MSRSNRAVEQPVAANGPPLNRSVGRDRLRNHRSPGGWIMPTLLQQDGFQFVFYASEHEPKHVHAFKGDDYAKIELRTLAVKANHMKPKDLGKAFTIVQLHNQEFEAAWDDWQRKRRGGSL